MAQKLLKCSVITPAAKIIECDTPSVVLPAHDGQVGILPGHMPIFCQLGLGMMEIKGTVVEQEIFAEDIHIILDGGFAMVSKDVISVIANEAITAHDLQAEKHEKILKDIMAKQAAADTPEQLLHDARKKELITRLGQLASASRQHTE